MKKIVLFVLLFITIIATAQKKYTSDMISYWEYDENINEWEEIDSQSAYVTITFLPKKTSLIYLNATEEVITKHRFIRNEIINGETNKVYNGMLNGSRIELHVNSNGVMKIFKRTYMVMYHNLTRISDKNGLNHLN